MNPIVALLKDLLYHGLETLGLYYSTYRGFVVSNEDPNNLNRLRLLVPEISSQPFDLWAHQKNNYSGIGYGMHCLPEKGDLVWVEFERGRPEKPIWSYGHWGNNEKPNDASMRGSKVFWFKTPKGNRVYINDTTNTIIINNAKGETYKISESGLSLISDKKIFLGSDEKAKEAAMMGDSTKDVLNDMLKILNSLNTRVSTILPDPEANLLLTGLIEKMMKVLSQKVKLD